MQQIRIKLNKELFSDSTLFFQTFQPICDLYSLYNGPKLANSKLVQDEKNLTTYSAKGIVADYAFTYYYLNEGREVDFSFFYKGEILFNIFYKFQHSASVMIGPTTTPTVELELRKLLLQLEEKIEEKKVVEASRPLENVLNKEEKEIAELDAKKCFLSFDITERFSVRPVFLEVINSVCQAITNSMAPKFTYEDVTEHISRETHESFYTMKKSSNDYSVLFDQYDFDTGHHSNPNGGHLFFKLFKLDELILHADVERSKLYYRLSEEIYSKYKSKITELSEGKL